MGRPQKSSVFKANATALGDMAEPLRAAAGKVLDSAGRVHAQVLGFDWQGHTKDAADARANREYMQDRAVAVAYDKLADAYEHGSKAMQPMIDSLKSTAQGLEGDHFAVSEDWAVTDTYDYDAARKLAKLMDPDDTAGLQSQVNQLQSQRANEAATETTNLQRLADQLGTADTDTAKAIDDAKHLLGDTTNPNGPPIVVVDDTLAPGGVRNLGPVAGTGANPGVPNLGAVDLGEVITLPNGKQVAIFGDSFSGNKVGEGAHYPSVAVPVHTQNGRLVIDGPPLTGPDGTNVLFPLPQAAKDAGATNTLPAGSITVGKDTYMMVVGTNPGRLGLAPMGGSWLVKVTDNPAAGWEAVKDSYRPWQSIPNPDKTPGVPPLISDPTKAPTQISGYQGNDGRVYIAADGFDRQQGVTMYSVDPQHIAERGAWQPWTGNGWGTAGQVATAPVTEGGVTYGELSFRDVGGNPVLSGFNAHTGSVDLHVGETPTSVFDGAPTVVAPGGQWGAPAPGTYPQNYGGYILPGSTLDDMGILVSQWNTDTGTPYVVEQFQVNPNK